MRQSRTRARPLLQADTSIKAVSERFGHRKSSITLYTYAHVLPDFQHLAAESFESAQSWLGLEVSRT